MREPFAPPAVCEADPRLHRRVANAIEALGYETFRQYLLDRTVKPDGRTTWALIDMADELRLPRTLFIRYHARWVDEEVRHAGVGGP